MFRIQSRPDTYQTGLASGGRQVVMGPFHMPWVVAVFFDKHGTLLGVERKLVAAGINAEHSDASGYQESLDKTVASWKSEIGFIEAPIAVKPFFLKEYFIGIEELPLDLADYLSNPSKYPTEDQAEFLKDIVSWKSAGNFVFSWSESYHLDKNGESL